MNTIAQIVRARAGDERVGLRFEDESWTYAELLDLCAQRAAFLLAHRPADAPFHVGVLLDNVPDFWMLLGASALAGATLVGINPTRRGAEQRRPSFGNPLEIRYRRRPRGARKDPPKLRRFR